MVKKEKSPLTTLCYIEQDGKYLMLHRIKKEHDINEGKWIGVGGHFEDGESPEECLLREVREETGLTLVSWRFRGIVTFRADDAPMEYMCLYTADSYVGELDMDCEEGVLRWVPKEEVTNLPLWEGDRVFLELLAKEAPFFSLKLSYVRDRLVECVLDGRKKL
ncbi:MAG: 8-oxo-dGTP diphosphatase [Lachnospiraceae bacterium]|nr:8-oxo-dGTP diphosphatase [Lachnospiraceae bacterium]